MSINISKTHKAPEGNKAAMLSLFGSWLKEQRGKIGMTQKQIAQKTGYRNSNYICMIENGKTRMPATEIFTIADAYQLPDKGALLIVKLLHPELWKILNEMVARNPNIFKTDIKDIETQLQIFYQQLSGLQPV